MFYKRIGIWTLVLALNACKTTTDKDKAQGQTNPEVNKQTTQINELASRYLELGRFSGTILVAKGDTILFENSYGMADYQKKKPFTKKTSFKVGAITELFTRYIIRQLANTESIHLDSLVATYLPKIQGKYTVRDLLEHQSRLPTIQATKEKYPDLPYNTITFANKAVVNEKNIYSDLGYNLLGAIIESQSKKSYRAAVQTYFAKLALEATYFTPLKNKEGDNAKGYVYRNYGGKTMELRAAPQYVTQEAFSSNGLKASARDLWKLAGFLPDQNIQKSGYTPQDGFSYSLLKDGRQILIVLSNRRQPITHEIVQAIRAIYKGQAYQLPLPRKTVKVEPAIYKAYIGKYKLGPNRSFEVTMAQDSLFALMGPMKVALYPQSKNQFYMKERDAAMRFVSDTTGVVGSVILYDGFLKGREVFRVKE